MFKKRRGEAEGKEKRAQESGQEFDATKRRLLEGVGPALMEGENLIAGSQASFRVQRVGRTAFVVPGWLGITDRRVLLVAQKFTGRDVMDFDYAMITSIDHSKGAVMGNISIAAAGDRAVVRQLPSEEVEQFVTLIREQMRLSRLPPPTREQESVADKVRDLAKLREEGLMTEEEFERKRRELLGL